MISLEQVRQLDIRVKKAVTALKTVSAENSALKAEIAELKARLEELNTAVAGHRADEQELEVSLQGVLDVLDEVEGETSDVEPEPPADNYVVETVPLDEESEGEAVDMSDGIQPENTADPVDEAQAAAPGREDPEDSTGSLFDEDTPEENPDEIPEETGTGIPVTDESADESADEPADVPAAEPAAREAGQAQGTAGSVSEDVPGVGQVVEFTTPGDGPDDMPAESAATDEEGPSPDAPEVEEVDLKQPPEDPSLIDDSGDDEFGSEFDIF